MQQPLDLAAMRERAMRSVEAPPVPADTLVKREHTFHVVYPAPDGVVYEGNLCSSIPSYQGKSAIMRFEADLCMGRAWDSLPRVRQGWIQAISRVSVQLKDPPTWVLQWAQEDDAFLRSLYDACLHHEALFFPADFPAGQDAQGRPKLVVDTGLPSLADVAAGKR